MISIIGLQFICSDSEYLANNIPHTQTRILPYDQRSAREDGHITNIASSVVIC